MATNATTTARHAWNTAYSEYLNLNQKLAQAQPHERDALERAVAAYEDELLDMSAPSFAAILQKLNILWETDLEKPDQDGEAKRLIVEDITDLIADSGTLLDVKN